MKSICLAIAGMLAAGAAAAQAWHEPARGSAERRDVMDALRGHAEWSLGAPVQFVVYELRVAGDRGFAAVQPQRPGGAAIDPATTPAVQRSELYLEDLDGLHMEALLVRVGQTWVAVEHSFGATEAWWAGWPFCADWQSVIPEFCAQ